MRVLRDEGFSRKLDVVKLRGYKNHYRLRVGKYRVLFELEAERKIIVYAVLPKKLPINLMVFARKMVVEKV
ncbi:MAG: hypothetical protein QXH03_09910 [Candidatus Bathyarchaeia archaeon]